MSSADNHGAREVLSQLWAGA